MPETGDPNIIEFPPEVVLAYGLRTFADSQRRNDASLAHKTIEILEGAQQLPLARYFQNATRLKLVDIEDTEEIQKQLAEYLNAVLEIFEEFDFHRLTLTSFYSSIMEILKGVAEELEFYEIKPAPTPEKVTLTKIVNLIREVLAENIPKEKLNTLYNYLQALLSS
ncbi:hypothetical protein ACFL10_01180 [Patescibacteria group bacterium]